jgi:hypothetical protein
MVYFQTKNPNLGKFLRALDWKMLIYFVDIWNSLQTFVEFYDHLVQFVLIWYIFSAFGIMHAEKSGNHGAKVSESEKAEQLDTILRSRVTTPPIA